MKKFILLVLTTICLTFTGCNKHTTTASEQQPCITFLGIPVDGTKTEMIYKLEAKGYTYDLFNHHLAGEFNGIDVVIDVQTVNGRVWRIVVTDVYCINETDIKIRFNNLFDQFSNNSKYVRFAGNIIDENDDIFHEMRRNKRYEAAFKHVDESINGGVWYMIDYVFGNGYRIVMFYENSNNAADGSEL